MGRPLPPVHLLLAAIALGCLCFASCGKTGEAVSGHTGGASVAPDGGAAGGHGGAAPADAGEAGPPDAATGGSGGGSTGTGGAATGDAGAGGAAPTCKPTGPLDCSPSTVGSDYQCLGLPANFAGAVKNAVQAVVAQHPAWFDTTQGFPCCPLCLQPAAYMDAVLAAIQAGGLCAELDPNNPDIQIVVKLDADCSEGYLLLTSGDIVRNPPKYSETCVPAWL